MSDANAMEIRAALAPVLKKSAQVSVQLTVPNSVVRSILPELATTTPEAFAAALWSSAELARMASDHLREANQGDLAFFERSDASPSNPFTSAGLA